MDRAAAVPDAKLAWVAAILDLKGTIIRKNNRMRATPQLVLSVDTKHHGVVSELCRLTGQEAEPHQARPKKDWMKRGCTTHCPEPDVEYRGWGEGDLPPTARWTVTGAGAAVILYNVIPFMVTDKGLEDAMNEMMENLVTNGRGVGMVRSAVLRLAALGWQIPPQMAHLVPAHRQRLRAIP